MTSPIQQIEDGIDQGSWEKVVAGFEALTGRRKNAPAPAADGGPLAALKDIAARLREFGGLLEADDRPAAPRPQPKPGPRPSPPEPAPAPEFHIDHAARKGEQARACRAEPLRPGSHTNQFRDEGDASERDTGYLPKKPSPRRPRVQMAEVVCAGCGTRETVTPDLVPRRVDKHDQDPMYKCQKCINEALRGRGAGRD